MLNLTPFLLFEGTCAEAMHFYRSVFGGQLTITRVGDMPGNEELPLERKQLVAHAQLKSDRIEFSATDWQHPTRLPRPGNTVAMYLSGGTYAQLKDLFDKLSVGADPSLRDDLRQLSFGTYGHMADQFGIHWFFQGDPA